MRRAFAVVLAILFTASALLPFMSAEADGAIYDVAGTVTDDGGSPIDGVDVTVIDHAETETETTGVTVNSGEFQLNVDATEGTEYKIKFEYDGAAVLSCSLDPVGDGWYDLGAVGSDVLGISVIMTSDPVVTGRIVSEGGAMGGAVVYYYDASVTRPTDPDSVTADANGLFALRLDPSKKYHVEIEHDGHAVSFISLSGVTGHSSVYSLDPLTDRDVTVIMYALDVTVSGTVIINEGIGLTGVTVKMRERGSSDIVTETSDADGKFTFPAENGKVYELRFEKNPYGVTFVSGLTEDTADQNVYILDLTGNRTSNVDIAVLMSHVYGTLSGTVRNEDGAGLSEVFIEVLDSNNAVIRSIVSSNGTYYIDEIPIGSYTIKMSRSDLETQTVSKDITEGTNTVNFTAKSKINTYIFGLDLTHSMMFIAIILGFAVIGIVTAYRIMIGRKADQGEHDDIYEMDDDRDLKGL